MPNPNIISDVRVFTSHGLTCSVSLGLFGYCGYVRLPEGAELTAWQVASIQVHGGITYNHGGTLGFDTCHVGDGIHPDALGYSSDLSNTHRGRVWEHEDVVAETHLLARQVAAML